MDEPFLSIIIPVYNAQDYILQTLQSCKNQTINDFEVIIVNDGSTDKTKEIISAFCETHSNFRLLNKENGGVAMARNHALKYAQGQHITFLDADDTFDPEFAAISKSIIEKKAYDCIIYGHATFSEDVTKPIPPPQIQNLKNPYAITEAYPTVWAKVFKTKIILDKKITFFNARTLEDVFFTLEFLKSANNHLIDNRTLYKYRTTPNSLSRKISTKTIIEREKIVSFFYQKLMPAENKKSHLTFFITRIIKQIFLSCGDTLPTEDRKITLRSSLSFYENMLAKIKKDLELNSENEIVTQLESNKVKMAFILIQFIKKLPMGIQFMLVRGLNKFV